MPLGWTFFYENSIILHSLYRIACVTLISFSKSLQLVNRITRAFPENSTVFLHLWDATTVAAAAFLLPVPALVGLQTELSKIAHLISKTTNMTAKISAEIN